MQVYLGPEEQERLANLARRLNTTKSDVVRRGLLSLEDDLRPAEGDPMLSLIGIITESRPDPLGSNLDPARDHDQYLADAEERSWYESRELAAKEPAAAKPARRRRGR